MAQLIHGDAVVDILADGQQAVSVWREGEVRDGQLVEVADGGHSLHRVGIPNANLGNSTDLRVVRKGVGEAGELGE